MFIITLFVALLLYHYCCIFLFSSIIVVNGFTISSLPTNISRKIPTNDTYVDVSQGKQTSKVLYFLPNDAGLFSLFLQTKIMYRLSKRLYYQYNSSNNL